MPALDGFDLTLAAGRCGLLVGHNGSGKTTAVLCLTGRVRPTAGRVRVCGHRVTGVEEPEARALVSLATDAPVFYPDLTVREHVELVAVAHGQGRGVGARVDELLEELDLAHRAGFLPHQLSAGMRQKTQLACALIRPFRLLVLDEPALRLDGAAQQWLWGRLASLKAQGVALLVTSHDPPAVRELVDEVVVLEDGVVAARGDYDQALASDAAARGGFGPSEGYEPS